MPVIAGPVLSTGLLVDVRVQPSASLRQVLYARSRAVVPIDATFMLDTGADRTMVDDQIFRSLAIQPTSQTRVIGSTSMGVPSVADVYDVELDLLNPRTGGNLRIQPIPVTARPLLNSGVSGLIGRDVLDRVKLVYDGPAKRFEIHF